MKQKNQRLRLLVVLAGVMLAAGICAVLLWMSRESSTANVGQEDVSTEKDSAVVLREDFDVKTADVGERVDVERLDRENLAKYFTAEEIPEEIALEMTGRSYQANDQIALSDLSYLRILYYDFSHEIIVGELVVNKGIAEDCQEIFLELFEAEYEIASMQRIDAYYTEGDAQAADVASINADNTSAFCYRTVAGSETLSNHALGYAIDINPLENPSIASSDGEEIYTDYATYADRSAHLSHMISEDDVCYQIFTAHGFSWGGSWGDRADYQHFEKVVDR